MSDPELVSIVIPVRNGRPWLEETLTSALTQADCRLEVVVVDDGSDDGSAEAALSAGDARLRVLRQPPRGVSHARNAGTAAALGQYLQYLDADDVLEPGTIARRLRTMHAESADVALADWIRWERVADGSFSGNEAVRRRLGPRPDVDLLTDAWWPPGAVLYRREMVEKIGPWRTELPIIQDARFLLDAALAGARFAYVTEVGLKYRVLGASSLSRRDPRAFLDDCYRSARDLEIAWTAAGELDAERRGALVKVYGNLARQAFTLDRDWFRELVTRISTLEPEFQPAGPRTLRMLSRLIGYPAAEHVAFWWRHLKGAERT